MKRRDFIKAMSQGIATLSLASLSTPIWAAQGSYQESILPESGPYSISGRYPHLAMFNHQGECGIGAVVPWAGRLWAVTYSPHEPFGSNDGLYEITPDFTMTKRPESIGGTPANRMIHRESGQLFIGPYAIDKKQNVRAISYENMPDRPTANARHLNQPGDKIYYITMEEGMYEVDVHSLDVATLYKDQNTTPGGIGGERLPGYHGKGGYSGHGLVFHANNGRIHGGNMTDYTLPSGCLATWDGKGKWQVIEPRQFTDITGPDGIQGAINPGESPIWSIGWDYRSIILKMYDQGSWDTYRLPKGDYSYEGLHGWHTEWPRIRQVGPDGEYLLNMHGMWFEHDEDFSQQLHKAPRPIATYLKITADFARWQDQLVFGCDDAALSSFGEQKNILGQSQSNLWFTKWEALSGNGNAYGWGGPWLRDTVVADTPTDPYSFAGFKNRQLHLSHENEYSITFHLEVDRQGTGKWESLMHLPVPAFGYVHHQFSDDEQAEWIRITPERSGKYVTASFHYGRGGGAVEVSSQFRALVSAFEPKTHSRGILRPRGGDRGTLQFAAQNNNNKMGYYELDEHMSLKQVHDDEAFEKLKQVGGIKDPDFSVDEASVIIKDQIGNPYRLPKSKGANFEGIRTKREVVTERDLFNVHGTIYWLPRPNSGGVAHMKPVTTHNKKIYDFCSWRGLLVMSGCLTNINNPNEDPHYIESEDGKVGLWVGDVDDLWKMGKPRGQGGPWKNSEVVADRPSDPYLMTGFDQKEVRLSHNSSTPVTFTIEVDVTMHEQVRGDGYGRWHPFKKITVQPGQSMEYEFPNGFSAHWVRLRSDQDTTATALFIYS